ncbi:hypothetical protein R3P38DRAFT_2796704 [Favolaschia claudopus]|uniref:Uncharacterized protein n=1 Tax=Favolaschia claudopus TaxID=2862362 RepID=A0AAW0A4Y4_9AGAR
MTDDVYLLSALFSAALTRWAALGRDHNEERSTAGFRNRCFEFLIRACSASAFAEVEESQVRDRSRLLRENFYAECGANLLELCVWCDQMWCTLKQWLQAGNYKRGMNQNTTSNALMPRVTEDV